jgi:molybdopterin converting factor small subunit
MNLSVEFYGIARQRAGVDRLEVALPDRDATLAAVLRSIGEKLPEFAAHCLDRGRLHPSLSANLDGERFVTDPETFVRDGQSLLILSADAGG